MNKDDIEKLAISKISDQVLQNSDCLTCYLNTNDKTPFWDGSIWVYDNKKKSGGYFQNKIDVQVKGRLVTKFIKNESYEISVNQLMAYRNEIKGTLFFLVDLIDFNNFKIYYCNLLPVDLYEIFKNIKSDQKNYTLKLKEIDISEPLNFKRVCLDFYRNSNLQAKRRIIDDSEFHKIEEFDFSMYESMLEFEKYLEDGDVYTYVKLKDTHEKVVTIKGDIKLISKLKKDIYIDGRKYYSECTIVGKKVNELVVGPLTFNFIDEKIYFKFKGSLEKRIKDLKFIVKFFEKQYFVIGGERLDIPLEDQKQIKKKIKVFNDKISYYKKIIRLFKYFNVEFDIEYENLNDADINNLHILIKMLDGIFPNDIKDMQKYYININKYKILFVVDLKSKKIYNYYSQEMVDNSYCIVFDGNSKYKTSIYSNLPFEDYENVSNFKEDIIIKSFKGLEFNQAIFEVINYLSLRFLISYDKTKDKRFLNLANNLNLINCKKRNDDVDIINSKQIKLRKKKSLSYNDKKLLSEIAEKDEYKNNYQILCCIDILLENNYNYNLHFKKMNAKDKEIFKNWPIYNLLLE